MSENTPQGAASALAAQPKYSFKIPESARTLATDPQAVTMRAITVVEERQATQVASSTGAQVAYEALKHSVIEVDGKKLTWDDGGKDHFVEGCSPKVRDLLLKAYAKIHLPTDKEAEDFFVSMKTTI